MPSQLNCMNNSCDIFYYFPWPEEREVVFPLSHFSSLFLSSNFIQQKRPRSFTTAFLFPENDDDDRRYFSYFDSLFPSYLDQAQFLVLLFFFSQI